ncbi:MAG: helix-hairpin-helix domain-containing protein [Armatimonadota bacterium]
MALPYKPQPVKKPPPADLKQKTVAGVVDRVTFRDILTGWGILVVRSEGLKVSCVGTVVDESPEGREFEFTGYWKEDPRYGWQFVFDSHNPIRPETVQGIRKYLAGGVANGIGDGTATAIVDFFEERTLEVLDSLDEVVLMTVPGIGKSKAEAIVSAWSAAERNRGLTVELLGKGLTAGLCVKVIHYYEERGIDPLEGLQSDPYQLTSLWGVGFLTADIIARKFNVSLFDKRRMKAAFIYALDQAAAKEGHCYLPQSLACKRVSKLLSVGQDYVEAFLDGRDVEAEMALMDGADDEWL